MKKPLWAIERNAVTRAGRVMAAILHAEDGTFGWRGLGNIERRGFKTTDAVLSDVKYFYRYPPKTRITLRSGTVLEW